MSSVALLALAVVVVTGALFVGRRIMAVLDDLHDLRVAVARVQTLRPVARDVAFGARQLRSGAGRNLFVLMR